MRNEMQQRMAMTAFRAAESEGKKRIEGYFVRFDDTYEMWEGATESIDRHAFDGQLDGDVKALIDHLTHLVLGRTTAGTLTLRLDEIGLWGSIEINENDTDALNQYHRVLRGDVSQCSIGFEILDERCDVNETTGAVHWTILKVRLHEVSVVTFPAYKKTDVSARKEEWDNIKKRRVDAWRQEWKERLKKWH